MAKLEGFKLTIDTTGVHKELDALREGAEKLRLAFIAVKAAANESAEAMRRFTEAFERMEGEESGEERGDFHFNDACRTPGPEGVKQ